MPLEYLIFDLLVAIPVLALALWRRSGFAPRIGTALVAGAVASAPFIAWDRAVAGDHWWFDPRYTTGVEFLGLPVEEWGFFVVVPFACLFVWEVLIRGSRAPTRRTAAVWFAFALAVVGTWVAVDGPAYTGLVLTAVAGFVGLDYVAGTDLVGNRRFWGFMLAVAGLTLVFDGYLTARPVVHYADHARSGLAVGTIPIEDFAYSLGLVGASTVFFELLHGRAEAPAWLRHSIEARLGGYRRQIEDVDETLPGRLPDHGRRRVAVIGGGLAGITAAAELGGRGFDVELLEKNRFLGGKVGAWTDRLSDGSEARVEHGFHAFFNHYYNLDALLARAGADAAHRPIDDYVILTKDGGRLGFEGTSKIPVLNLLSLWRAGLYRLGDVMGSATRTRLEALLRYDPDSCIDAYDEISFARWADRARLPGALRLVFTTFARAFFAEEDRVSMAELIKSFHFYYLSHDQGLGYRYIHGNTQTDLVAPLQRHLKAQGVRVRTGRGVDRIVPDGRGFTVDGEAFDYVVMAADVAASAGIVARSPELATRCPELASQLAHTRAGQRYAVLRVWLDEVDHDDLPVFVITERLRVLDAIAYIDRIDPECAGDGGVLELHCYAVPDVVERDAEIVRLLLEELRIHRPALATATVARHHLQVRSDFTAFHTGLAHARPRTETDHPRLALAGDWVRLPCPAMLMEGACTSGLLAANAIAAREGLQRSPVYSVPTRGIMAAAVDPERAATPDAAPPQPVHAPLEG